MKIGDQVKLNLGWLSHINIGASPDAHHHFSGVIVKLFDNRGFCIRHGKNHLFVCVDDELLNSNRHVGIKINGKYYFYEFFKERISIFKKIINYYKYIVLRIKHKI